MLIEILCKLVRLIFRNPIGVNVELYYGIISEENLREKRIKLNKLKGFGLDWIAVRSGED